MRFLVDASMPRSATVTLRQPGHEADDARDVGLRSATDDVIAKRARDNRQALITRDFDFADIRNYPPADFPGILVLKLPDDAPATLVCRVLEAFVRSDEWLARLSVRLVIVETWRVRFRPA
jgi:predicted nuclease of predicted toxin-antitoxin system